MQHHKISIFTAEFFLKFYFSYSFNYFYNSYLKDSTL